LVGSREDLEDAIHTPEKGLHISLGDLAVYTLKGVDCFEVSAPVEGARTA
jgi:hypothetical protein